MRRPLVYAAALAVLAALTLSACGGDGGDGGGGGSEHGHSHGEDAPFDVSGTEGPQQAATVLDTPFTKPDLVLADTEGRAFDLREETDGYLTLLYFGYTHCPDACPLTVSNVAIAYDGLSRADKERFRFVFVTTDPERDTPAELGAWLPGAGSPDFIGLSGDFAAIQAAARSVGVGVEPAVVTEDGEVDAVHGKTVLAFSPDDDRAHVIYGGGEATVEDYAQDIPDLLAGRLP